MLHLGGKHARAALRRREKLFGGAEAARLLGAVPDVEAEFLSRNEDILRERHRGAVRSSAPQVKKSGKRRKSRRKRQPSESGSAAAKGDKLNTQRRGSRGSETRDSNLTRTASPTPEVKRVKDPEAFAAECRERSLARKKRLRREQKEKQRLEAARRQRNAQAEQVGAEAAKRRLISRRRKMREKQEIAVDAMALHIPSAVQATNFVRLLSPRFEGRYEYDKDLLPHEEERIRKIMGSAHERK